MTVRALRPAPRDQATELFAADVITGLSANPKRLLPKYFYDETGRNYSKRLRGCPSII